MIALLDDKLKQRELAAILEKSPIVQQPLLRSFLGELPAKVSETVGSGLPPRFQALELVRLSNEYDEIPALVSTIEFLVAGSECAVAARAFLDDLLASAHFDRHARASLLDAIESAHFSASEVNYCARASARQTTIPSDMEISAVVRHLALLPQAQDRFPYPLIEFAARLARRAPAGRRALEAWAREAARDKKIEELFAERLKKIEREEEAAYPVVMIELDRHPDEPTKFSLAVLLWDAEEVTQRCRVDEPLTFGEAEARVDQELRHLGNLLVERFKVQVEVVVPEAFIVYDFDAWQFREGIGELTRSLGETFPTYLRMLSRIKLGLLRRSWTDRWNSYLARDPDTQTLILERPIDDKLFRQELENIGANSVGFCFSPAVSSDIWPMLINHGVPAAIWIRNQEAGVPGFATRLKSLLATTDGQLPRIVFERRREAYRTKQDLDFWQSIGVLWDNPERLPEITKFETPR